MGREDGGEEVKRERQKKESVIKKQGQKEEETMGGMKELEMDR